MFNTVSGSQAMTNAIDPESVRLVSDDPETETQSPAEMLYYGKRKQKMLKYKQEEQRERVSIVTGQTAGTG